MLEESFIANEISNNKNKQNVRCQFCNSLILRDLQGLYEKSQFDLPLMHQKNTKDVTNIETESLEDFWVVDDMFTFENIGFSNTVDQRKFLICADCDMGPVGYHNLSTKKCYIALKRVKHGDEPVKAVEAAT
ncbi:hypothetical protein DOY81_001692 [Sarcophaga bullata]|nr:hypothetical protein DOY81_001692 [Sarcophaga bullata]